jgi:hypothetical protein
MAATPEKDSPRDRNPESPRWLGSVARRGLAESHGAGWTEFEDGEGERPKWLGSVARREGSRTSGDGWVEADKVEQPKWLGSVARRGASPRSLVLIDMETTSTEQTREETSETPQEAENPGATVVSGTVSEASSTQPEPIDELDDRRQTRVVAGEIGMHLRVA